MGLLEIGRYTELMSTHMLFKMSTFGHLLRKGVGKLGRIFHVLVKLAKTSGRQKSGPLSTWKCVCIRSRWNIESTVKHKKKGKSRLEEGESTVTLEKLMSNLKCITYMYPPKTQDAYIFYPGFTSLIALEIAYINLSTKWKKCPKTMCILYALPFLCPRGQVRSILCAPRVHEYIKLTYKLMGPSNVQQSWPLWEH